MHCAGILFFGLKQARELGSKYLMTKHCAFFERIMASYARSAIAKMCGAIFFEAEFLYCSRI